MCKRHVADAALSDERPFTDTVMDGVKVWHWPPCGKDAPCLQGSRRPISSHRRQPLPEQPVEDDRCSRSGAVYTLQWQSGHGAVLLRRP